VTLVAFTTQEILDDLASLQPDAHSLFERLLAIKTTQNRANVAAWRARQSKETLKKLRRQEYLRNRERRLQTSRAYKASKRRLEA
jgi:hypothetical protein